MKTKEIIGDRMGDNIEILYNKFVDVINDFAEIDNIGDYEKTFTVIKAIQLIHFIMITVVAEDKETAQRLLQANNAYLQNQIDKHYEQLD